MVKAHLKRTPKYLQDYTDGYARYAGQGFLHIQVNADAKAQTDFKSLEMIIAKKLDRIFKRFLPKEFTRDKQLYQDFFAQVAKVATDESDIIPWIPVKKSLPDHKEDVMVWVETDDTSTWHLGWYDWQHDEWIIALVPNSVTKWKVTHWIRITKP